MTDSHSAAWKRVQMLEDMLATLNRADGRRRIILRHAWHEGDWDRVYVESKAMGRDLARLHAALSERWRELMDDV